MRRTFGYWVRAAIALSLPLAVPCGAASQGLPPLVAIPSDSTVRQEIELRDGTTIFGRIVTIEGDVISVRTVGGVEITLDRSDIRRVREVSGQVQRGEFWHDDPSDSRLFLAPTARVSAAGTGYFGVYELVVPSFGVGIGGIAMMTGGMSIVPGIDIDEQVFYLAPKVQVFDAGVVQGALGFFWVKPGDSESAGLGYAGVTAGDFVTSFSGGIAIPWRSRDGFGDQAVFMLGGETRVARDLKLITENWISPDEGSVLSFGVRIVRPRLTVEAAAVTTSDGGFAPLVNFSVGW